MKTKLPKKKKLKICITSSPGGHLTEALQLLPILGKYDIFFLTLEAGNIDKTLKNHKFYILKDPLRNPIKFLKLTLKSLVILFKEKPDIIISTGAGATVPISIFGKLFLRSKLIFIESSAQVFVPSLTSKILYWFSDLFFVQWRYLLKYFGNKARYRGLIILS